MKILVICNAESHWSYGFVKNVLLNRDDEIVLVSIENSKYKEWYKENGIRVLSTRNNSKWYCRIKYIRTFFSYFLTKHFLNREEPDVFISIYPSWIENVLFNTSRIRNRGIYYYIGSDLMRVDKRKLRLGKRAVCSAENVAFNTEELKTLFYEAYGKWYKGQAHVINFGMSHLDNIDNLEVSIDECRNKYLDADEKDRLLIAIGYNGSSFQQVDRVLAELELLPEVIKKKIKILVPMQYGINDAEYCDRVEMAVNNSSLKCVIIRDYYDGDQMAEYVKAVDVFINSQITDAQAAAVVEQLYAGTIMLNASWLEYAFLETLGLYYPTYGDFSEMKCLLIDIIENIEKYKMETSKNHMLMAGQFTWEKCKSSWNDILDDYSIRRVE